MTLGSCIVSLVIDILAKLALVMSRLCEVLTMSIFSSCFAKLGACMCHEVIGSCYKIK